MSNASNIDASPSGSGSGSSDSSSQTIETRSLATTSPAPEAIDDVQHILWASTLPKVIFVLGGPGAGKSTICKRAVSRLNETGGDYYGHLSAGDHLRDLARAGTAASRQHVSEPVLVQEQLPAEAYAGMSPDEMLGTMQRSELMRSDKIVEILCWKLTDMRNEAVAGGEAGDKDSVTFIVDGFPRTLESAVLWEAKVGMPTLVLLIHSSRDTAERRFLSRGRETGDTVEKHTKRFDQFLNESGPILDLYMTRELMIRVDNEDNLDDAVAETVGHVRAAMRAGTQAEEDEEALLGLV